MLCPPLPYLLAELRAFLRCVLLHPPRPAKKYKKHRATKAARQQDPHDMIRQQDCEEQKCEEQRCEEQRCEEQRCEEQRCEEQRCEEQIEEEREERERWPARSAAPAGGDAQKNAVVPLEGAGSSFLFLFWKYCCMGMI